MKFSGLSLQRSVGCRLRCGLSQQLLLACSNKRFSRLRGCHFSSVFSISSRRRKRDRKDNRDCSDHEDSPKAEAYSPASNVFPEHGTALLVGYVRRHFRLNSVSL
ncbi:hypothetical protein T08_7489 [Trichinella sp. T8]|nr:hypothetical protein T08_7489 [Trichinella sp. T8]